MVLRLIAAALLLAHAGIHLSFFTPQTFSVVRGTLPFDLTRSWALGSGGAGGAGEILGTVLVAVTVGGLAVGAAWMSKLVPANLGRIGIVIGASASIVTLLLFYHEWLFVGLFVDAFLLAGVVLERWVGQTLEV